MNKWKGMELKMKKKVFLITIDTEADNQWNLEQDCTTKNVDFLPRFQELAEKYNYKPVWLTTFEMANNDNFVEYFKNKQDNNLCEIGMHLHAWNNPPQSDLDNKHGSRSYLIEYSKEIMDAKIKKLDELLTKKFLKKPVSHRAGRWATNADYFDLLKKYNYKIDCSMTPGVNWSKSKGVTDIGGSDYSDVQYKPFYINDSLLEIPVTIKKIRTFEIKDFLNFKRLIRSIEFFLIGRNQWVRPDKYLSSKGIKKVIDICNTNNEYIMFMLHSSELMPGGNPSFKSEQDIEKLYSLIDNIFQYVKCKGYIGMTLEEFYNYYKNNGDNDEKYR